MNHLQLVYASATWEVITNIPVADAMQNASQMFRKIYPDDLPRIVSVIYECLHSLSTFYVEIRYIYSIDMMRWLQMSAHLQILLNDILLVVMSDRALADKYQMYGKVYQEYND